MIKANISNRLLKILSNLGITTIVSSDMSFIDIDEQDENLITFTPTKKINEIKFKGYDPWKTNRNKIKVGKFLNNLLIADNTTIENLTNRYKCIYKLENGRVDEIFDIVEGKDIFYYFQRINYVTGGGSLSSSCMTNASEERLQLYTINPKKIKLLVIKNDENKVLGRCIMWHTNKGIYLDRAYCRFDNDIHLYVKYSELMGFKSYYNHNDRGTIMTVDKLKIPNTQNPYLDTFKNFGNKSLTNNNNFNHGIY